MTAPVDPSPARRHRLPRRVAPLALFGICAVLSCMQGERAPSVAPTRTLAIGTDPAARPAAGEFGVVFSGPRGEVTDPSEVTIVWNRPMRPLDLAGDEAAPPASITIVGAGADKEKATPKGQWRWMGTSALAFFPDPHLPRASEYEVKVPVGTRALGGEVMAKEHAFRFTTPGPRLVRLEPYEGSGDLTPTTAFELRFNQPMDPKEIERATRIEIGDGKNPRKVAVRASRPKSDVPTLVKVTAASPLPLDAAVALVVGKTLRGIEGPRTLGEDDRRAYRTYGPLTVRGIECSNDTPKKRCAARGGVRVDLSNRVSYKEFRAHARIEGAPLDWSASRSDESAQTSYYLPARMSPARSYRLVVTAGMKDAHGQLLAQDASFPIDTDDEWPEVQLGLEGGIFEAAAGRPRDVPVGTMNVASYDLVTAPLDEGSLVELLHGKRRWQGVEYDGVHALKSAKIETVRPGGAKNQLVTRKIALDQVLAGQKGRGAAAIGVRHDGTSRGAFTDARVVTVTDVGISAKMSRFGSVVWATRLSDGKPIAGAKVSVRGANAREEFVGKTDAQGLCTIAASDYAPVQPSGSVDEQAILFVRDGDDWAYRAVSEMVSAYRYSDGNMSTDIGGELRPFGMVFTDRGVYRPGETVRAKALFRVPLEKGTRTPKGEEYVVEAYDSQENKVFEHRGQLGAFGELTVDVPVPASTRLGQLEIRAELGGAHTSARGGVASQSVLLAAYKAAEFKVAVEPERPTYVRGEKAAIAVHGDYLFGAPMGGGKVRYTVTRGPGYFQLPGAEGLVTDDDAYAFGIPDGSSRAGQMQAGDGALDAKGTYGASVDLKLPNQRGTEVVAVEAEVEDVARQTIAGRSSVIVHPGDFYVAMRPPKDLFVAKGAALRPELLAIEPGGKKRAGVKVQVELLSRSWNTVVEASGESHTRYDSRPVDKKVGGCEVTTTEAAAACDVKVENAGYFLLRATAKDARGNVVGASTAVYATSDGAEVGWSMSDAARVELVPDKKSYEPGDTAKVLVKSPFREAEALITVERHGIYRQERRKLVGSMPTLSIPIGDDLRPNAFVSVHLVRGRTQAQPVKGQDIGAPAFRLGYAQLRVNPESRRLKVAVSPTKKDLRPGDELDVDLAVTDRTGKPTRAEVTFYAVDEGVLMLTGYKTPDPIPTFTAPRPLAVFAIESREDLAKIRAFVGALGGDKGMDGGGGGASVREDFRATAHFQSVVTADNGKARVHFKLPDSVTTYRLMAVVAAEDDRFGFGESQIVTSRPLMARPALPRFLRAGDAMEAGVVLSSKGMPATEVDVTLTAEGADLGGAATKVVALPANGSVEVRWAIATPNVGHATFTWKARARGGAGADDVRVTREVQVPMSPEAVALYGATSDAVAEKLGDLSQLRPDVGGLDVRVASTALVGLDDGMEQLIKYPYGCTEQLTSRLVPLLPLRQLAQDFGLALPKDIDGTVSVTVGKILERQLSDGSFGWWPNAVRGDAWITAYALWGVSIAKNYGQIVPDAATANAVRYLRGSLARSRDDAFTNSVDAFIVDVLAIAGSPDAGYTTRLYERRDKLPLFARALLAHAMATAKMRPEEAKELVRDMDAHLRVTPTGATVVENLGDAYAPIMDSEARTTAMVIRAYAAIDPHHPLQARLAKGLLGMRDHGTWRSTQETAWALLALDDYKRTQEGKVPDFDARVFMGESMVAEIPFHGRSLTAKSQSFPIDKLLGGGAGGSAVAMQVKGTGKLFYEARLRYAKKELPAAGLDRGFFVRKVIRSVRPEGLSDAMRTVPSTSASFATAGDLVLVDLLVVTPDPREHVVVDDPLPAGLEPVQTELATTARSLDVTGAGGEGDAADDDASSDDARANGGATTFAWYHREVRDDRVLTFVPHMPAGVFHYRYLARATTHGTFVVPPTRAECMYEPETFGRTGAARFEVKAR